MSRSRLVALGKNLFQNYKKQALIVGCACSCLYIGQRAMSSSNKRGNYVVQEPSRATRKNVENNQKSIRETYINMPREEKRKLYKCGKKYVLPSAVQDWSSYASAEDLVDKYKFKPKYDVNEDLNSVVCLWRGDITKLEIDGIVNAANNSLLGGGGVDGAIHSAAGWKLREECSTLGGCPTGEAKITAGYNLPATYVIHTVGPIGVNPEKLRNCYINSLNLAVENDAQTVAFPCISTGIYGYDIEKATPVVLKTVREWLCDADNRKKIKKIIFCVFLERDVEVYEQNLLEYFPVQYDKPTSNENEKSKEKKSAQKNKQQDNSKNKASVKDRDKKTDNVKTTKPETDDKGEVVTVNKEEDKNNQALEGHDTENTSSEESKEKLTSKTRNVSEKTVNENGVNTERLSKNKTEHATEDSGNCETKVEVESAEGAGQVGKKTKKAKSGKEEDIVGPAPKKKPGVSLDKFRPPTAVL